MITYLLSKASTGKFRFAVVETDSEWHEPEHGYIIQRSYGQVRGKTTLSPAIIIDKTKQKRTWQQQLELQYNSEVKKYKDKGYVEVDKHPNEYSEEELAEIYGEVATNQAGIIKPMLAKQESKLTNRKILDKKWLCSRKIDGVRCLMYYEDGEILTASRGGENYNPATTHLRQNPDLIKFFQKFPNIILDGELYRHGKTLQQISGAARMEKNAYDCDWLQYWVYDMYDKSNPDLTASKRQDFLYCNLPFYCYHSQEDPNSEEFDNKVDYNEEDILLVNQLEVSGEDTIWKLHNQYVSEGFEGCVIRNPDKPYKPNGRTNDMLKFKQYRDDCFKVIGIEGGLRGIEDMVFILETSEGKQFKAKPMGDLKQKEEYWNNFEKSYKGHIGECKFFYYSDDNVPLQPSFKAFRFDLE